ncbi:DUF1810 domain-containing protein [Acetobacterium sp.]|jgi:uncharacterized protein (DUF1810 family)|uniref:DUF1810 domain-containing protein n=1 Tax=Acetobacterium sp. TaxID=1872094 RepID=UPI000CBCDA22|nr:DUF1810 domain-containing protein [Acetobacterium sp.]MDO9490939.1 DUF1810 domain-containing protein [Acetobacterium sp.]PKM75329.1 MAG: DUF1810 domain-containing protein [Firmicutes bacterium HGW-Firmicutes-17]
MNTVERFVKAQEESYRQALIEIKNGRKHSHWMWYVFPQLKGLGRSEMARYYGIANRHEAKAYLAHPLLGSRLLEISGELLNLESRDATAVFGRPDDVKLKSSMTLFYLVDGNPTFKAVLDKFFGGQLDEVTADQLDKGEITDEAE